MAPEERRPRVQSPLDEVLDRSYLRHARQPRGHRPRIRREQRAAGWEIVRGVGRVVVDEQDVDAAVQQKPDRVVLERFAAVDRVKLRVGWDAGRAGVGVEGVRVGGVSVESVVRGRERKGLLGMDLRVALACATSTMVSRAATRLSLMRRVSGGVDRHASFKRFDEVPST